MTMIDKKYKRVKLKGNESFNFREGWLRKGMRCVEECDQLFSQNDVMERLGVGSKMVKSIRFWLQATGLCEERIINSGRNRAQYLTDSFGRIIYKYDPYFDDIFTLFLLHYKIVSNDDLCIAWNIFFNEYEGQDFSKDDMIDSCKIMLDKKMEEGCLYSESSFEDDCSSIIKMYLKESSSEKSSGNGKENATITYLEDSLECPLNDLGLIKRSTKKGAYIKTSPSRGELDKLAVLYVMLQNLKQNNKTSVSINDLVSASNNVGKIYNLSRVAINDYLDQLRVSGYLTINRTAGLDMVYIESKVSPEDIMIEYYEKTIGR